MPSQIILFSQPRSGCHMLERMLSKQSNLKRCWHPFESNIVFQSDALKYYKVDSRSSEIEEICLKHSNNTQVCVENWKNSLAASQSTGEIHFVHEHPLMLQKLDRLFQEVAADRNSSTSSPAINTTDVPDSVLLYADTVPIFTIRNPVLSMPSAYRAWCTLGYSEATSAFFGTLSLAFTHELYDFYVAHNIKPLVVDADDYMTSEDFMRHFCAKAGLNPAEALFHWDAASKKELDAMHPKLYPIQETLVNSQGPMGSRAAKNLDLDEEKKKWKSEFSQERLEIVEKLVDRAMPHYEYLWERRLTL